ncbi:Dyp-type peroxidase [Nocardioides sp. CER19]|uniref:Dyp-type peroxidase n=1 Tax=Nocardioides sp. CER19 TaxID=3038538 RepID=UPI00244A38CA|nr:Dyp-type peroxidase [Nocardioides sp. CER19]MDH2413345.1 Dyp-type peroxidase [Nocardioides sp. CER19]
MSLDRRQVLTSAAVLAAGAVGVSAIARGADRDGSPPRALGDTPAHGAHQAGIDRPVDPQTFALVSVVDVATQTRAELGDMLAALGRTIAAHTADGSGDLTATVAVGPRLVRAAGDGLPGSDPLPLFAGDDRIPASRTGGDLLLALHGSDAGVLERAREAMVWTMRARVRWAQHGFRASAGEGRARNLLGFLDGVVVPRTEFQLQDDVWIPDGPAANGTICVVRRLRLDVDGFRSLPVRRQERIIGRRLSDGAPLSGGAPLDQVDLGAKTPAGEYVVPAHAHARAAHPSFTGSHLMLRRSYSYANPGSERGLVFISFQRDLDTFVRTQRRLDETDALMHFATATASASFLVLPGFDDARALGATLFR